MPNTEGLLIRASSIEGAFSLQYQHLPTTIDQQIEHLRSRGIVGDEDLMRRWLKTVGYYRLSAYWLPWELPPADGETRSKRFPAGTNFKDIVDIYIFDRRAECPQPPPSQSRASDDDAKWRLAAGHSQPFNLRTGSGGNDNRF